ESGSVSANRRNTDVRLAGPHRIVAESQFALGKGGFGSVSVGCWPKADLSDAKPHRANPRGAWPMKPFRMSTRLAAVAVLALGASASAVAQPEPPTPLGEGPWNIETEAGNVLVSVLTRDLQSPWSLAFLPDGDMLLTERPGRLRLIRDGQLDPAPIEELPELINVSIGG